MTKKARNRIWSFYQFTMCLATFVLIVSIITSQIIPGALAWAYMVTWVYFYNYLLERINPHAHHAHPYYF
jgi:hypothetical protein